MMGTVVFRGVPNQPESASRSASAAVPVGSSMVAAQAMDVDQVLPVSSGLAEVRAVGEVDEDGRAVCMSSASLVASRSVRRARSAASRRG
jgi:hypothetical protein